MASGDRLTQLRALVDRLERLPASTGREWMLEEARSRMVDVETGDKPRPLRTLHEEPPAPPAERPEPGVGDGRVVKRPSSKRPEPQPPRSVPSPPRHAAADWNPATLGTDDLLWLGEPSGDPVAEPGDGSTKLPPWRRGLRG